MTKFIKPYGLTLPPIIKVFKWKVGSLFQKKRAWVEDDDFKLISVPIGEPHSWMKKLAKTTDVNVSIVKVGEIVLFS